MKVDIDQNSGFCFGVVYAIQMAEDELDETGQLYCLGDIVHNDQEVDRLKEKGLEIITHEQLSKLRDCKVLIRAHGEPPETYKIALKNNIDLIDASCPVVLKLQHRVRVAFNDEAERQIVIYGKPGHAEVNGLVGQTHKEAIIVTNEEDLAKIDYEKPISLFSQTTKSPEGFYKIWTSIEEKARAKTGKEDQVMMNDTICRQVSNRAPELKQFSRRYDVVLFVSGKKSSNGKVLYESCKSANPNSYFISTKEELDPKWFNKADSVGICGATSTPMWLMEEIGDFVRKNRVNKTA